MSRHAAAALLALVGCGGLGVIEKEVDDSAEPPTSLGETPTDTAGWPRDSTPPDLDCPSGETACPDGCVDVSADPRNCGGCGIVCVVPQGTGTCEAGTCGVGECADGWGDCDGTESNGCETEAACSPDVETACTTTCDSQGTLDCTDVCAPTCLAPAETCDHTDEDCDGVCDDGELPGCRQGVHRSSGSLGHMYGPDLSTLEDRGQSIESANYFYLYSTEVPGTRALYRCDKGSGRTFLTTSATCELGVSPELTVGYIASDATCGGTPLYRLYSGTASNHFYTTSATERDNAVSTYGYRYEAVVGYVYSAP